MSKYDLNIVNHRDLPSKPRVIGSGGGGGSRIFVQEDPSGRIRVDDAI